MGRPDAFYVPPEAWREPFVLTGSEAGHCVRVLRKRPGEIVRCFDGQGREGLFTIEAADKDRVALRPRSLRQTPPPAVRIHLAPGFSKSARRDAFLEKAVELGAAGILFWQAARTQGQLPRAPKATWTATLVAAAKQCGAAFLPGLETVAGGAAGLAGRLAVFDRCYLLWENPNLARRLGPADLSLPGDTLCILGPEGGLEDAEVRAFLDAGAVATTLGPRVLRWETAGLAVLALALANGG